MTGLATKVINLERGLPTVEAAMSRLRMELATCRKSGVNTLKIVHGYGSSGQGGSIRAATLQYLREQKQTGRIRGYCPGEKFGSMFAEGSSLAAIIPACRQDTDWGRQNQGITVAVI